MVVCGLTLAVDALAAPSFVTQGPAAFHAWPAGFLNHLGGSALDPSEWGALTAAMYGFYLLALAGSRSLPARAAIGAIVVLHLAFLVTPPIASKDVFNYISYARLGALHGMNPYTHAPNALPGDPVFGLVGWPTLRSPYGPLYTLFSYVLAPLGIGGALWAAKAMATAAAGGCVALVWRLARRLGRDPLPAVVLVGLNPAWLVWGVGGAHNDFLMVLLELVALALWVERREAGAAGVAVLAAGVKAPALALAGILVAAARERRRALAGAAIAGAALVLIALLAFGGLAPLTAFRHQSGLWTNRSLLGEFVRTLAGPQYTRYVAGPAGGVMAAAVAAALAWAWRGRQAIAPAAWAAAAMLFALTWEFPWYVAWLLPLAAVARGFGIKLVAVTFAAALLAGYVPPYFFLT